MRGIQNATLRARAAESGEDEGGRLAWQDSSKDEVLAAIAARKKVVEPIDVPEWGGSVYIRHISAADVKETGFLDNVSNADIPVRVLAKALADENGEPLFSLEDVEALAAAEFDVVIRAFAEAARINGLTNSQLDEAMAAFGEAQGGDSSTS